MLKEIQRIIDEKMNKTIAVFMKELASLRAGRANVQVLDRITVEYYGVPTPINQLANISIPEPRLLLISLWDAKLISEVEKAIQKSDIGINPSNDGKVIRLVFPELTEERRRDLMKKVRKKGEDAKVAVRSIRREANEQIKKLKKDSTITEDEMKKTEEDIQEITDEHIKNIDRIIIKKEEEMLEV